MQHRRLRFNSWVGKVPWRRAWQHTPLFFPGASHGQRSLEGCSPWAHKESDMAEGLTLSNLHDDFGTRFQMARPTCPSCIPWLLMLAFGGLETGLIATPLLLKVPMDQFKSTTSGSSSSDFKWIHPQFRYLFHLDFPRRCGMHFPRWVEMYWKHFPGCCISQG